MDSGIKFEEEVLKNLTYQKFEHNLKNSDIFNNILHSKDKYIYQAQFEVTEKICKKLKIPTKYLTIKPFRPDLLNLDKMNNKIIITIIEMKASKKVRPYMEIQIILYITLLKEILQECNDDFKNIEISDQVNNFLVNKR